MDRVTWLSLDFSYESSLVNSEISDFQMVRFVVQIQAVRGLGSPNLGMSFSTRNSYTVHLEHTGPPDSDN